MRTPLAVSLGFCLLAACQVGDVGGGDDDDTGAVCGDSVKEGNEACDDGNSVGGDGCSSTCTVEPIPRLDVAVDKLSINTELKTTHMLTVTLIASGGFSGPVTLTGTAINAASQPLQGWTVAFDNATPTLTDGATVNAVATVTVPSENKGLAGTIKIDAASSLPTKSTMTSVTVLNQVTIEMTINGNGNCVYPAAGTLTVTNGSMVRFLNKDPTNNITIHMQDEGAPGTNLNHQPDPGSAPNAAYEQTINATVGGTTRWYCHAPGPTVNGLLIQAGAP